MEKALDHLHFSSVEAKKSVICIGPADEIKHVGIGTIAAFQGRSRWVSVLGFECPQKYGACIIAITVLGKAEDTGAWILCSGQILSSRDQVDRILWMDQLEEGPMGR